MPPNPKHPNYSENIVRPLRQQQAQSVHELGLALHQRGELDQAKKIYQQVLLLDSKHSEALHLLGVIAAQTGDRSQAVELIGRSIEVNANNAAAYANLGNVLAELGRFESAVTSYDSAIALHPNHPVTYCNRGLALHQLRKFQAAIESYDRSIYLEPGYAEAYVNRGVALFFLGKFLDAIASYDVAIAISPNHPTAHYNRGRALSQLRQFHDAIASYDRAITIRPDFAEAHANRGNVLAVLNQHEAAIRSYDKTTAINPHYKFVQGMKLHEKMKICDWEDISREVREIIQGIQCNKNICPPFAVFHFSDSLPLQHQVASIWAKDITPSDLEIGCIQKYPRRKKIRVGYFSMNFNTHPVARLTAELFELHDRNRFEVYAFSFGFGARDDMRIRLESGFDQFFDVKEKSDKEIVIIARQMQIDIAIDLAGFTADSRPGIFALRAAPLQVNYLGFPGTMGAEYIDYIIADKELIPDMDQLHYTEKIIYLPVFQANDRKRQIAEKIFTREELCLPQNGFVFCCFNNNAKFTPETFDVWMRILINVDNSFLLLFSDSDSVINNLVEEALKRGVEATRLVFCGSLKPSEYLARYRAADLFLDTLPFNAGTTSSDALWAGLPVLTCAGKSFSSRMGSSLLRAIGLPELVTTTYEDYETLAIELATSPQRIFAIKQKLQQNRLRTPLFDTKSFAKNIEAAYSKIFELHQSDLPPQTIVIEPQINIVSTIR